MIDNLARVHPDAKLGNNVSVGPFSTIAADVVIGDDTRIESNVVIMDGTQIGTHCHVFPGAVIGASPQDLKYNGENTKAIIGNHCVIRECVTINRGTTSRWKTQIGNHTLLMAYTHIGHDSLIGNHCILANSAGISGHVTIEDYVTIEGQCGVAQFVHIGAHSFVGGLSGIRQNIPPYVKSARNPLCFLGVNAIGMKRRGMSESDIAEVTEIYKKIYIRNSTIAKGIADVEATVKESLIKKQILDFIRDSKGGIIKSAIN